MNTDNSVVMARGKVGGGLDRGGQRGTGSESICNSVNDKKKKRKNTVFGTLYLRITWDVRYGFQSLHQNLHFKQTPQVNVEVC